MTVTLNTINLLQPPIRTAQSVLSRICGKVGIIAMGILIASAVIFAALYAGSWLATRFGIDKNSNAYPFFIGAVLGTFDAIAIAYGVPYL